MSWPLTTITRFDPSTMSALNEFSSAALRSAEGPCSDEDQDCLGRSTQFVSLVWQVFVFGWMLDLPSAWNVAKVLVALAFGVGLWNLARELELSAWGEVRRDAARPKTSRPDDTRKNNR